MPGDPAKLAPGQEWRRGSLEPGHVADVLRALVATDRTLAERAVTHALALPKTYDLDRILVPALREVKRSDPAIEPLRAACLAHLRARIAEPLAPPADWRRTSKVSCTCEQCRQLAAYIDDPRRGCGSCARSSMFADMSKRQYAAATSISTPGPIGTAARTP
jgi:hypothetical protein